MAAISPAAMEVPVGLLGDASSTPRVAGPQFAATEAASSWKRAFAPSGNSLGVAPAAATKCRLQG